VTLWLLLSLSTVDFVVVEGSAVTGLTVAAVGATIVWALVVCRREGLVGPRADGR
jgi:hypothetical protein